MLSMAYSDQFLASIFITISYLIQPSLQNTHYASPNNTVVVSSVEPCHLYGDADIYGIGIRLSFYIQWATIILAFIAGVEGEIKTTRRGFNIVALAVLINTFISATNGSFAILELYIVSTLVVFLSIYLVLPFGGQINFNVVRVEGRRGRMRVQREHLPGITRVDALHADPIGIGVLALIDAAFLFAQPWLYFVILKQGAKPGCNPKIFVLFTSVALYSGNWVRFLKVFAVFAVVLATFVVAPYGINAIAIGIKKTRPPSERDVDVEVVEPEETPRHRRAWLRWIPRIPGLEAMKRAMRRSLGQTTMQNLSVLLHRARVNTVRLVFAIIGASLIAFVEKTIQINDIDLSSAPLTTTSQLLPFLVGLFSAVSLLWVSVRKLRKEGRVVADAVRDRTEAIRQTKAADQLFEFTRKLRERDQQTA